MIDLSILVCSTHTRYLTFGRAIQDQLWGQYAELTEDQQARVEIMIMTDNKRMMLGEKRNVMVDASHGRYVQFVDDDDRIAPDMIETVLTATEHDADVITFLAEVTINGGEAKVCRYSLDYQRDSNTPTEYRRIPNHICAVKGDLARRSAFPSLIRGEDSGYAKVLRPLLGTEHHIERVLYFYDYSDETTETQVKISAPLRRRGRVTPVADIVILSDAHHSTLRRMTQSAIDTAIAGANSLPVHVTVVEQQARVSYQRAEVVHRPGPFNYNASANAAAGLGSAPWIVVANNDLRFEDGWLHELIAAGHPLVSPMNPGDPRQAGLEDNETGLVNGRHFSGWCFMISRELWTKIGGMDERVSFWCSDDVTVEQCSAAGVQPMIVPTAVVNHLESVTLRRSRPNPELTWGQVRIFNELYNRHKFEDDPRYLAYLRRANRRHGDTIAV